MDGFVAFTEVVAVELDPVETTDEVATTAVVVVDAGADIGVAVGFAVIDDDAVVL